MELGVREWFLILGGLMIAGVLAHGAWIFFRSRKNEIGLQYERNIPDADIDDLELLRGELPSGGARVRPATDEDAPPAGSRVSSRPAPRASEQAAEAAEAMDGGARATRRTAPTLDADSVAHVPVLMDPIDRDLAEAPLNPDVASAGAGRTAAPAASTRRQPPAASRPARSPSAELADDLDELDGILSAPRTLPAAPDAPASIDGSRRDASAASAASAADAGAPEAGASSPMARGPKAPGIAPGAGSRTEPDAEAAPVSKSVSPQHGAEPPKSKRGGPPAQPGAASTTDAPVPHEPPQTAPRVAEPGPDMEQTPLFAGQPIVARERSGRDSSRGRKPAGGRAAPDRAAAGQSAQAAKRTKPGLRPQEPPEDVIVVRVLCRHGGRMPGPTLLEVITDRGLRFGDMNIFHRYAGSDRSRIEFSLASAVEPGTFDLGAMDDFETPGVTLFLQLPGPEQPLDAFEDMVSLAKALAEELDAELKDEQHSVMTAQTIEHCRNRIREFTRRQMSRRA